jgi:hypothetical protein
MKNVILILLINITIIFVISTSESFSSGDSSEVIYSDFGTEFWIAIPHIYLSIIEKYRVDYNTAIQLWISSKINTNVTIESRDGLVIPKKEYPCNPDKQLTIDLKDLLALDDNDNEIPSNKGIHITSDDPVSVNVFMAYQMSGEAYHAIPVEWLGKNYYINNLYQDSLQGPMAYVYVTSGEIVIIASQDNTQIKYYPTAITQNGTKPGSAGSASLQKGQTFLIQAKKIQKMSHDPSTDLSGLILLLIIQSL